MKGYTSRYLLLKGLVTTTLALSTSVTEFIDSLKRNSRRLKDMGSLIPDWILTAVLLHNLGDLYDNFVRVTASPRDHGTEQGIAGYHYNHGVIRVNTSYDH